ncbi:MAG TPA: flagellar biosynthesis anti-sigma factor FlgM [Pirellulaceae bacterium]
MQIHGPSHILGTQPLEGAHRLNPTEALDDLNGLHGVDQVEISPEAEWVSRIEDVSDVRTELVQRIRQEIAAGTYETGEKLDIAIGRLLDEVVG